MAATAAYVRVVRIPASGGQPDNAFTMNNSVPASDTVFNLDGGKYGVGIKASTYGTVALQMLLGDGATWVAAFTAVAADGYTTIDLPPGQYRIHLA